VVVERTKRKVAAAVGRSCREHRWCRCGACGAGSFGLQRKKKRMKKREVAVGFGLGWSRWGAAGGRRSMVRRVALRRSVVAKAWGEEQGEGWS
jgi:hypothetical protein